MYIIDVAVRRLLFSFLFFLYFFFFASGFVSLQANLGCKLLCPQFAISIINLVGITTKGVVLNSLENFV